MSTAKNPIEIDSYTLANFQIVKSIKSKQAQQQKQQQKQHQLKCQQLLDSTTPNYVLGYN